MPDRAPGVRLLTIQPTLRCNLACHHCPVLRSDNDLKLSRALQVIRWVADQAPVAPAFAFQGGEPLLRPGFLLEAAAAAVEACSRRELSPSFAATTNATLLTRELLRDLGAFGFELGVSIDGPPDVQVRSRGPRSQAAWHVLPRALATEGLHVFVVITLTPLTAPHLSRTVDRLVGEGVLRIELVPDLRARWSPADMARLRAELGRSIRIALSAGSPQPPLVAARKLRAAEGGRGCAAGSGTLALGADGLLYGCAQLTPCRRGPGGPANPIFSLLALGRSEEIHGPELPRRRSALVAAGISGDLQGRASPRRACRDCRFALLCAPCPGISLDFGLPPELIPVIYCDMNSMQFETMESFGLLP